MPKVTVIDPSRWSVQFLRNEMERMAIVTGPSSVGAQFDKVLHDQYEGMLKAALEKKMFGRAFIVPTLSPVKENHFSFPKDVYSTAAVAEDGRLFDRIKALDPDILFVAFDEGGTMDPLDRAVHLELKGGLRLSVALHHSEFLLKREELENELLGRIKYEVGKAKQRPYVVQSYAATYVPYWNANTRKVASLDEHLLCNHNGQWGERALCKEHAEELKDACTHDGRIQHKRDCKQHWEEYEAECLKSSPQANTVPVPSATTPTKSTARSARPGHARSTSASAATTRSAARHLMHKNYTKGCGACAKQLLKEARS